MKGSGGRSLRSAGMVVAATVLLAACGDDEDDPAAAVGDTPSSEEAAETAPPPEIDAAVFETDPCGLLTSADVKALLGTNAEGEEVAPGDAETLSPAQCEWETGEAIDLTAPNDTPFSIIVSAGDTAWYDNSLAFVEDDESFEELTGIGDQAFAGNTRGGFRADTAGITVELGISSDPASHEVVLDALDRVAANHSP